MTAYSCTFVRSRPLRTNTFISANDSTATFGSYNRYPMEPTLIQRQVNSLSHLAYAFI